MTDADAARLARLRRTSRRALLGGAAAGAVAGGGVIAGVAAVIDDDRAGETVSGGVGDPTVAQDAGETLEARRVERVPVDDPRSGVWDQSATAAVALDGQLFAMPTRPEPFRELMTVQALHDGASIGFRLAWEDDEVDDLTIAVGDFRDACAVLLAEPSDGDAVRLMGTADVPATILHWKADWQRDVDLGFQDLEVAFPNGTFDYYPPLAPLDGAMPDPADYTEAGAEQWLPGMAVDNLLSEPSKLTPVEKGVAIGFGSLASQPTQDARGRGVHEDGGWSVVLAKPLSASDEDEVALRAGETYSVAFALWSGRDGDAGGHKSPSRRLHPLRLEA